MPDVAPIISETTTRMSAIAVAILSPVMMNGAAAGRITLATIRGPDRPNVRAVRIRTGSTPRTPSMVFTRMGNEHVKKMVNTFVASPMPKNTIATGIITGGGTARRSSIAISLASYARRQYPMTTPRAIATM